MPLALPRVKWARILPILTFLAGIIGGIFIPLWLELWVQTPALSIELDAINREISTLVPIAIGDHPKLKSIVDAYLQVWQRRFFEPTRFVVLDEREKELARRLFNSPSGIIDLEILDKVIEAGEKDLSELPKRMQSLEDQLTELEGISDHIEQFTPEMVRKYNSLVALDDRININDFNNNRRDLEKNQQYFERLLQESKENLRKRSQLFKDIMDNIPNSRRAWEETKKESIKNRAVFKISAIAINTGKASVSIRRPALFRVYIGIGNYIDIRLISKEQSEVKPYGTTCFTSFLKSR